MQGSAKRPPAFAMARRESGDARAPLEAEQDAGPVARPGERSALAVEPVLSEAGGRQRGLDSPEGPASQPSTEPATETVANPIVPPDDDRALNRVIGRPFVPKLVVNTAFGTAPQAPGRVAEAAERSGLGGKAGFIATGQVEPQAEPASHDAVVPGPAENDVDLALLMGRINALPTAIGSRPAPDRDVSGFGNAAVGIDSAAPGAAPEDLLRASLDAICRRLDAAQSHPQSSEHLTFVEGGAASPLGLAETTARFAPMVGSHEEPLAADAAAPNRPEAVRAPPEPTFVSLPRARARRRLATGAAIAIAGLAGILAVGASGTIEHWLAADPLLMPAGHVAGLPGSSATNSGAAVADPAASAQPSGEAGLQMSIAALAEQREQAAAELAMLEAEARRAVAERARLEAEAGSLRQAIEAARRTLIAERAAVPKAVEAALTDVVPRLDGAARSEQSGQGQGALVAEAADLERQRDAVANELAQLAKERDAAGAGVAALALRQSELAEAIGTLEVRQAEMAAAGQVETGRRDAVERELADLDERRAGLTLGTTRLTEERQAKASEVAALDARRAALISEQAELTAGRDRLAASVAELAEAKAALARDADASVAERERISGKVAALAAPTPDAAAGAGAGAGGAEPRPVIAAVAPGMPAPAGRAIVTAEVGAVLGNQEHVVLPGVTAVDGARRRVFVHYSKLDPRAEARAAAIARSLVSEDSIIADLRAVPFAVAANRIRYFHAEDAIMASPLRQQLGQALGSGPDAKPIVVQDFSSFRPLPASGTVEIWLAGG